jgi:hypothetical protein
MTMIYQKYQTGTSFESDHAGTIRTTTNKYLALVSSNSVSLGLPLLGQPNKEANQGDALDRCG